MSNLSTVAVHIDTAALLGGQPIPNLRVRFELTGPDVTASTLLLSPPTVVVCDAAGLGVANLVPNVLGTQGRQTKVTIYSEAGEELLSGLATVQDSDCALADILLLAAPPSVDDGLRAVLKARDWASKMGAAVEGVLYSAKYYAGQAATDGSAWAVKSQNWAQQLGGEVTGYPAGSRSSRSWAQEDLRGVTYGGSAKDWASGVGVIDGMFKSARAYAVDGAASAQSALTDRQQADADALAALAQRQVTDTNRTYSDSLFASMVAQIGLASAILLGYANTAQGAVSQAQASAAAAASVPQQDLSGVVSVPFHRGPANVLQVVPMDTTKDSNPDWSLQALATSWYNEQLTPGSWLGPQPSELIARTQGATLGAEALPNATTAALWTANGNAVTTTAAGRLQIVGNAFSSRAMAVTVGVPHVLRFDWLQGATAQNFRVGNSVGGQELFGSTASNDLGGVVVTPTVSPIYLSIGGGAAGASSTLGSATLRPLTALATKSGDFFQDATDGKYKRVWRNLLPLTGWAGGTGGTVGAGAVAPTGWSFGSAGGTVTYVASTYNAAGNAVRFQAAATRPFLVGVAPVVTGPTYSQSCRVEATDGTVPIVGVLAQSAGAAGSTVYKANGATVTSGYVLQAGDLIEVQYTFTAASTVQFRYGLGASSAATGDITLSSPQTEILVSGGSASAFENKTTTDTTTTEVFRGNTRTVRRAEAVVEAGRVVVYDVEAVGRPMWKVLLPATNGGGAGITGAAYQDGCLTIVGTGANVGAQVWNFPADRINFKGQSVSTTFSPLKNSYSTIGQPQDGGVGIVSGSVNAVSMCTYPNAPRDPTTGLQIPTVALATGGGVSLIQPDGSVVNSASTANFVTVTLTPYALTCAALGSAFYSFALKPATLAAAFVLTTPAQAGASGFVDGNAMPQLVAAGRNTLARRATSLPKVVLTKWNEANPANSLTAYIADTYTTGWQCGDIRGTYCADVTPGAVTGSNKITNGTFDVDASGWASGNSATLTAPAGVLRIANGTAGTLSTYATASFPAVVGTTYTLNGGTTANSGAASWQMQVGIVAGGNNFATANTSVVGAFAPLTLVATATTMYVSLVGFNTPAGGYTEWDNIVVTEQVADRSYKAQPLAVNGTVQKTAVASLTQLIAYSGFSAANYLRAPYSVALDFATGGFALVPWVNIPAATVPAGCTTAATLPHTSYPKGANVAANGNFADASVWTTTGSGWSIAGGVATHTGGVSGNLVQNSLVAGTAYRIRATVAGGQALFYAGAGAFTGPQTGAVDVVLVATGVQIFIQSPQDGVTVSNVTYEPLGVSVIAERSGAAGASVTEGIDATGKAVGVVVDSAAATRTVTSTASYAGAGWVLPELTLSTSGTLALKVNGAPVASTTGAPLASLSNAAAVLTIGNNFAGTAPFPGSIALVRIGATVPTDEQSRYVYEQEKELFRDGAQCTLPDAGALVGMSWDAYLGSLLVASAANESAITGLVRTSTAASAAGNINGVWSSGGLKFVGRTGTNPGLDFTYPAQNLREALLRQPAANDAFETFEYSGGFTGNTNPGANATLISGITGLTLPSGGTYVGAQISGPNIPAGAVLTLGANATNAFISIAATGNAVGSAFALSDFILPVGWDPRAVYVTVAGATVRKREGGTLDYSVLYDGFRYRVRFLTAPGATAVVHIDARQFEAMRKAA